MLLRAKKRCIKDDFTLEITGLFYGGYKLEATDQVIHKIQQVNCNRKSKHLLDTLVQKTELCCLFPVIKLIHQLSLEFISGGKIVEII